MSEWIELNLPWIHYDSLDNLPKLPNLKKKMKKIFGKTTEQAYKELTQYKYDSKDYKSAARKYKNFRKKVDAWAKDQPESKVYAEELLKYNEAERLKSFCGRGLNKVGTMIEVLDNGINKQLLIGDINPLGGVCDDCMGFSSDAIILRYKHE